MYYRRLTPMPDNFNLLDILMNNWFDGDNKLNNDFALYSSYMDAYFDTYRWLFCNFSDAGVGFPRDCGPTQRVSNQWNSYTHGCGDVHHHAFMIPVDPYFKPQLPDNPLFQHVLGIEYVLQKGTQSSGTIVTHLDNNDYMTYSSMNFGGAGTTHSIRLKYAKGNHAGKLQLKSGNSTGPIIAEFYPLHTGRWQNYATTYIGINQVIHRKLEIFDSY